MDQTLIRFLVEPSLKGLVKHLRMIGLDTVLSQEGATETSIFDQARDEYRVLLTTQREKAQNAIRLGSPKVFLLETNPNWSPREAVDHQLRSIIFGFPEVLKIAKNENFLFSRCLHCNAVTLSISPEMAAERISSEHMTKNSRYQLCPRCERVSTNGAHSERLTAWLRRVID